MIVCAAIKIQIEGLDHETIVPALRHGHVYMLLQDLCYAPKTKYKEIEQGFITNKGDFLNRKKAYEHAAMCGQLNRHTEWFREDNNLDKELYSEDLY